MGRHNYAAVRALCEASAGGDEVGVIGALDPEVEWVERNLTEDACDRTHYGRALVAKALMSSWRVRTVGAEPAAGQVLVAGEHVVMHGQMRVSIDGRDIELPFTHVFTLRDGRVSRLLTYLEPPIAVQAPVMARRSAAR